MTLNIAILGSRGIPAKYGGFETFAEFLSVGMAKEGHRVTVYCPSYQEYKESAYQGVQIRFVPNQEFRFTNRVARAICNLTYDIQSLVVASRSDADVIYMLGYASGPFLLIPKLFGKKLAVNPDGLEWKSTRWGLLARTWLYVCEFLSAKIPDALITDAEPIAEHFLSRHGKESTCIPYGTEIIDKGTVLPTGYEPREYYLSVARMVPETKVHEMIDGFRKSGSEKDYLIVGPIADQKFFDTMIVPRLGGKVKYLGSIYDRSTLNSLRADTAALLHGHASDGTNPSLLESMGCSSPVIAIRRRSNIAVLTEQNGLYFDDAEELALQIQHFESLSEEARSTIGAGNARRALEQYSWAASVQAHIKLFEQISALQPSTQLR